MLRGWDGPEHFTSVLLMDTAEITLCTVLFVSSPLPFLYIFFVHWRILVETEKRNHKRPRETTNAHHLRSLAGMPNTLADPPAQKSFSSVKRNTNDQADALRVHNQQCSDWVPAATRASHHGLAPRPRAAAAAPSQLLPRAVGAWAAPQRPPGAAGGPGPGGPSRRTLPRSPAAAAATLPKRDCGVAASEGRAPTGPLSFDFPLRSAQGRKVKLPAAARCAPFSPPGAAPRRAGPRDGGGSSRGPSAAAPRHSEPAPGGKKWGWTARGEAELCRKQAGRRLWLPLGRCVLPVLTAFLTSTPGVC